MKVELIAYTPNPEKVVAAAAKLCYSNAPATDIFDGLTEEKTEKFLKVNPLEQKRKLQGNLFLQQL